MKLDNPTHWVIQRRISHKRPTLGHIVFAGTKAQCEKYKKIYAHSEYDQFIWDGKLGKLFSDVVGRSFAIVVLQTNTHDLWFVLLKKLTFVKGERHEKANDWLGFLS